MNVSSYDPSFVELLQGILKEETDKYIRDINNEDGYNRIERSIHKEVNRFSHKFAENVGTSYEYTEPLSKKEKEANEFYYSKLKELTERISSFRRNCLDLLDHELNESEIFKKYIDQGNVFKYVNAEDESFDTSNEITRELASVSNKYKELREYVQENLSRWSDTVDVMGKLQRQPEKLENAAFLKDLSMSIMEDYSVTSKSSIGGVTLAKMIMKDETPSKMRSE